MKVKTNVKAGAVWVDPNEVTPPVPDPVTTLNGQRPA